MVVKVKNKILDVHAKRRNESITGLKKGEWDRPNSENGEGCLQVMGPAEWGFPPSGTVCEGWPICRHR